MPELRVAVTAGEPGGIGPDLLVALAQRRTSARCVAFADPKVLQQRAEALGQPLRMIDYRPDAGAPAGALEVCTVPMPRRACAGRAEPELAPYVLQCIEAAGRACLAGDFDALVTGPVQKSALLDAGLPFRGHTEYLAEQAGCEPVMLLLAGSFRVALATTHLPLSAVPPAIRAPQLRRTLEILMEGLRIRFGIARPHIRVLGLNPHAGEGGHLGDEERQAIAPAIAALQDRDCRIEGPVSADTAFVAREGVDAFLAMYHDQGLPVLKALGFGQAVNATLGLPYVRTSVDHGTALELAGSGRADPGSLFAAVECAVAQAHRARQAQAA